MQQTDTAISKTHLNSIQDIPFDVAWSEGAKLENSVRTEKDGTTIFTGTHAVHGNIHIIIPAFGSGLLLFPFVIQEI